MNPYSFYQCAAHPNRQPIKTRCPACRVLWSIEALQKKGELKVNPLAVPATDQKLPRKSRKS